MNDIMFVTGCTIFGFLIPEILVVFRLRVPLQMNLLSALGTALIVGSLVVGK